MKEKQYVKFKRNNKLKRTKWSSPDIIQAVGEKNIIQNILTT